MERSIGTHRQAAPYTRLCPSGLSRVLGNDIGKHRALAIYKGLLDESELAFHVADVKRE
jgi:hypothetical protein